jgi:predicted Zn-dependent protease
LTAAFVSLIGLFTVGLLMAGSQGPAIGARPSASIGRAAVIPPAPADRRLFLAPIGTFPASTVQALVDFYRQRYGLPMTILEPAAIDPAARDEGRGQLVAEELIASMQRSYPAVVGDHGAIVIGLVTEDVYTRARTDWDWSFGVRSEGRFAVVSTARMTAQFELRGVERERSRLRKMVTRDIGILYYGLPFSENPESVLYRDLLGVDDLDRIGEDF